MGLSVQNKESQGHRERKKLGSSCCGSVVTTLTSIHEDVGSIPGPAQCSSQKWLRSHVAVAVTLIRPLAWELPYATGAVLKR